MTINALLPLAAWKGQSCHLPTHCSTTPILSPLPLTFCPPTHLLPHINTHCPYGAVGAQKRQKQPDPFPGQKVRVPTACLVCVCVWMPVLCVCLRPSNGSSRAQALDRLLRRPFWLYSQWYGCVCFFFSPNGLSPPWAARTAVEDPGPQSKRQGYSPVHTCVCVCAAAPR